MMGNKTVFQQKLEELKRAGEEKRLRELLILTTAI